VYENALLKKEKQLIELEGYVQKWIIIFAQLAWFVLIKSIDKQQPIKKVKNLFGLL
jgi:hypothetical protein